MRKHIEAPGQLNFLGEPIEHARIERPAFSPVSSQDEFSRLLSRLVLDYRAAGGHDDGSFERTMPQLQNACSLARSFLYLLPRHDTKSEHGRADSSLGLAFKPFTGRAFRIVGGDVVQLLCVKKGRYRIGLNRCCDCSNEAEISRLLIALFREVRALQQSAASRISGPQSPWLFRFTEIVAVCKRENIFGFWDLGSASANSHLGLAIDDHGKKPIVTPDNWRLRLLPNGKSSRSKRWGLHFEPPARVK